jgi:hypothetical protein
MGAVVKGATVARPRKRRRASPPPAIETFGWLAAEFTPEDVAAVMRAARVRTAPHDLAIAARHVSFAAEALAGTATPRPEAVRDWAHEVEDLARALLVALGCGDDGLGGGAGVELLEHAALGAEPDGDLADAARRCGAYGAMARSERLSVAPRYVALLAAAARDTAESSRAAAKGGAPRLDRERAAVGWLASAYRAATGKTAGVAPGGPAVRFVLGALALLRRRAGISWNPSPQAVSDMLRAARKDARD